MNALFRRLGVAALISVPLMISLAGCIGGKDVRVRVIFAAPPTSPPIENVTVFVGASKSWGASVAPSDPVSVVLSPKGEIPEVSMTHSMGAAPRDWRGPTLDPKAGYEVAITIAPDGTARDTHCMRPCTLR